MRGIPLDPRPVYVYVGFVVEKVALEHDFFEYIIYLSSTLYITTATDSFVK
jgi:hypothetical protein